MLSPHSMPNWSPPRARTCQQDFLLILPSTYFAARLNTGKRGWNGNLYQGDTGTETLNAPCYFNQHKEVFYSWCSVCVYLFLLLLLCAALFSSTVCANDVHDSLPCDDGFAWWKLLSQTPKRHSLFAWFKPNTWKHYTLHIHTQLHTTLPRNQCPKKGPLAKR